MPFRESLACGLQKCVGNLWKRDDFSDFNVIVEDTSFKCHRFILSACSGFFQGMFRTPMKEQIEGFAKLEGMTASTFEIIINAVYTGVEELSIDNVLDVWSASEMLQIDYLTEQCHTFVMENISVDTAFHFLKYATLYSAQTVLDHCLDFISRNFQEFRNKDRLLHLPFDQFKKIIANNYLTADREELVVEAILNWIKYVPRSSQSTLLDSGSDLEDINDTNDEQYEGSVSTNSLSSSGNQEEIHDQLVVSSGVITDQLTTRSQILETREIADTFSVAQCNNVSIDATDETQEVNRKQHFPQLLSACRLFRVKSNFLDSVMKNNAQLFLETGAYQLIHEALMYTIDVSRRHDVWPDAAVYRASSEFKHVMVFLSNDKLMALILNTVHVVQLAILPENFRSSNSIISVFDNVLYLLYNNDSDSVTKIFFMFVDNQDWFEINIFSNSNSIILLPHGNYIYHYSQNDSVYRSQETSTSKLYRFCHSHRDTLQWSSCGELEDGGNCLLRFQKYILVFYTKDNMITVQCYNTETAKTHKCKISLSGTSEDMVSFTHREDVYILQRNGCLWKVFSTDKTPVDFELVCKFWDFDCSLKGCVLYRKTLFVFCDNKLLKPTLRPGHGYFINIEIVYADIPTPCFPMTLKLDS